MEVEKHIKPMFTNIFPFCRCCGTACNNSTLQTTRVTANSPRDLHFCAAMDFKNCFASYVMIASEETIKMESTGIETHHHQKLDDLLKETENFVKNAVKAIQTSHKSKFENIASDNLEIVKKLQREQELTVLDLIQISGKCKLINETSVPQTLHEFLNSQKSEFEEILRKKDNIIKDLKRELKCKDEKDYKILDSHLENINLIVTRMNDQIKILCNNYQEEMCNIEQLLCNRRADIVKSNLKNFELMIKDSFDTQDKFLKSLQEKTITYEQKMNNLVIAEDEDYNALKSKLNADILELEQQLHSTETTYILNEDQLKYNYDILKKRHEDNMKIRSEQKRKLFPLRDQFNAIKSTLNKQSELINSEKEQVASDCGKYKRNSNDLRQKLRNMKRINSKTFCDIWRMNEEAAQILLEEIISLDEEIHSQILNKECYSSNLSFLDDNGPFYKLVDHNEGKETSTINNIQHDERYLNLSASTKEILLKVSSIKTILQINSSSDQDTISQFFIENFDMPENYSLNENDMKHDSADIKFTFGKAKCILQKLMGSQLDIHTDTSKKVSPVSYDQEKNTEYWKNYIAVVNEEKLSLWNTLLENLKKYHEELIKISELESEVSDLLQKNEELLLPLQQR
ncbi:Dynein regulatory complex protein 1 [Nymphon striatum]|nr:Dynein regulatory complex protein 1 [Nymphon striatum]